MTHCKTSQIQKNEPKFLKMLILTTVNRNGDVIESWADKTDTDFI